MDTEKEKAHKEVDAAMAEVDRLKTVASDLEKNTEVHKGVLEAEIMNLTNKIPELENDVEIQKEIVARIKSQSYAEQSILDSIKEQTSFAKDDFDMVLEDLQGKRDELATVETMIADKTKAGQVSQSLLEVKINSLRRNVTDLENAHRNTMMQHATELTKTKLDLETVQSEVNMAKSILTSATKETEVIKNEMLNFKRDAGFLQAECDFLTGDIEALANEKSTLIAEVTPLRYQMEAERETLKGLTKERIQQHETNRSRVELIDKREADLKAKYEEVGLQY